MPALAASTSSLTPARRAPQVVAVCFCVRLLCLPASWDAGADEAHGMLLPMQVRGRRTIVPTPYCQLTDPERQDQELLDIDLAEAPELPVSAPDEPLQVRCARARRDR